MSPKPVNGVLFTCGANERATRGRGAYVVVKSVVGRVRGPSRFEGGAGAGGGDPDCAVVQDHGLRLAPECMRRRVQMEVCWFDLLREDAR